MSDMFLIAYDGFNSIIYMDFLGQQNLSLTLKSGQVCFDSRVQLLCIHPDPFEDPVKYLQQTIAWTENGTAIDFTDPANAGFTPTRVNSTASTLSFDITEEDHRDRLILYTCFLVRNNANRDRDESETLVVDPPGENLYDSTITVLYAHDHLGSHINFINIL